jgi:16S rRNA G966 N2-methylase RsmD
MDEQSPQRYCKAVSALLEREPGLRLKAIAARLGMKKGYLSQLRQIMTRLRPPLYQRWMSDVYPLSHLAVYKIAQMPVDDQEAAYEAALAGRKATSRDDEKRYTPDDLAERMVAKAFVSGKRCLEPSAGEGAIVLPLLNYGADRVFAVEKSRANRETLRRLYGRDRRFSLLGTDFAEFTPANRYDRIVMNPPFSKDVLHILHAYNECLAPGGRLVALMSAGRRQAAARGDTLGRARKSLLRFVVKEGGEVERLLPMMFSGILVKTILLTLDKTLEETRNE